MMTIQDGVIGISHADTEQCIKLQEDHTIIGADEKEHCFDICLKGQSRSYALWMDDIFNVFPHLENENQDAFAIQQKLIDGKMIYFSAGNFKKDRDGEKIEYEHFQMDKYPVTNEIYAIVNPPYLYEPEKKNHPAVNINWYEAKSFAEKLGKKLPTSDQWEAAVRKLYPYEGYLYPWGNDFGYNRCNSLESEQGHTTEVNRYVVDEEKQLCEDMVGNVYEWTSTQKHDGYITRGGSFKCDGSGANCWKTPDEYPETSDDDLGFRCVKEPTPEIEHAEIKTGISTEPASPVIEVFGIDTVSNDGKKQTELEPFVIDAISACEDSIKETEGDTKEPTTFIIDAAKEKVEKNKNEEAKISVKSEADANPTEPIDIDTTNAGVEGDKKETKKIVEPDDNIEESDTILIDAAK
ncbi:MAG: formylglycine-generating enzyme family protein [Desulfobacterales bacterium]|nr:formylglycine-generating enzyme family protein [Desulfobacterales bacterium]